MWDLIVLIPDHCLSVYFSEAEQWQNVLAQLCDWCFFVVGNALYHT